MKALSVSGKGNRWWKGKGRENILKSPYLSVGCPECNEPAGSPCSDLAAFAKGNHNKNERSFHRSRIINFFVAHPTASEAAPLPVLPIRPEPKYQRSIKQVRAEGKGAIKPGTISANCRAGRHVYRFSLNCVCKQCNHGGGAA